MPVAGIGGNFMLGTPARNRLRSKRTLALVLTVGAQRELWSSPHLIARAGLQEL